MGKPYEKKNSFREKTTICWDDICKFFKLCEFIFKGWVFNFSILKFILSIQIDELDFVYFLNQNRALVILNIIKTDNF